VLIRPITRVALIVCLVAIIAGACNRGGTEAAPDAKVQHYEQDADVTLRIEGHRSGGFEGRAALQVLRSNGPGDVRLFVLGLAKPVDIGGATADAYVQLKNYAGSGEYDALPGAATKDGLANDAYVTWIRSDESGEPVEAYRYDQVARPCAFEIDDDGERGTATCQALAATGASDIEVTLTMTWRAVGEKKALTDTDN